MTDKYDRVVEETMNNFINKLQISSMLNIDDYEGLFLNYLKKAVVKHIGGVDYRIMKYMNKYSLRLGITPEKEIKIHFINGIVDDQVYGIHGSEERALYVIGKLNNAFAESSWFIYNVEVGYDIESTIINTTNLINNFNFK
jgi:hypothetical protein